jgi:hypothetical protein
MVEPTMQQILAERKRAAGGRNPTWDEITERTQNDMRAAEKRAKEKH